MICPRHNVNLVRRKSQFRNADYLRCPNYPACKVTAALHPDGRLMSTPADHELKRLRQEAHRIAGFIWGPWNDPVTDKKAMYDWLKQNTKEGHIGMMTLGEIKKTIKLLKVYELKLSRKGQLAIQRY